VGILPAVSLESQLEKQMCVESKELEGAIPLVLGGQGKKGQQAVKKASNLGSSTRYDIRALKPLPRQ